MDAKNALSEFLKSRIASKCATSTIKSYQRTLTEFISFIGDIDMEDVEPSLGRDYLLQNIDTCKASTSNQHRKILFAFFRFLEDEGWITPKNWKSRMRKAQEEKPATRALHRDEVQKLLNAVSVNRFNNAFLESRDNAVICLLIDTGLRRAQFCSLMMEDIDIRTQSVHVRAELDKGKKERYVFYGETTSIALKKYLKQRRKYLSRIQCEDNNNLWVTRTGSRLSPQELFDIVKDLCKLGGVKHIGPHGFRHTNITMLLANGYPVGHAQALAGHANPNITQRYVHLASDDLKKGYRSACPMDNIM